MKVFLTGATGVVGTRALPALVADGHEVTAVARSAEKAALVRELGGAPATVDLFDAGAVAAAVAGHEAVVHLATHVPPLHRAARPSAWATNDRLRTEAAAHLADAALAAGIDRYVQESICFPYVDGGDAWIDEDHPVDHGPGAFVGAGRAEATTARVTAAGGTGVVLRFAQFYGPGSHHTEAFTALARRRVDPFVGDPDAYVSMLHAADAGSAVAVALRVPAGTYNVADDEPLTRAEAGRAVAEALGVGRLRRAPRVLRALAPASAKLLMRSQRVSSTRFRALGWAPAHPSLRGSWPTGVEQEVAR